MAKPLARSEKTILLRQVPSSVAERKCYAFPDAITKTPGGLSAKNILIRMTAKPSFAARLQTDPDRLCLNAVRFGDGPELPRLSSRGFRCENTLGGGLAADKICLVFHTLRVELSVAERKCYAFPTRRPIISRRLSRQKLLCLATATHRSATKSSPIYS